MYPHDHTVPSDFNACIVFDSDSIATTSVNPCTCMKLYFVLDVPSPVVPYSLYPDTHTVPSAFNTAVYWLPAVTSIAFSMFVFVGSVLVVLSPNPSCPYPLYPHVHTVPSDFSATW